MNRFFTDPSMINHARKEIAIIGEDVKHISRVLRLNSGDWIEVCDGKNYEYIGEIKAINKDKVMLTIIEQHKIKTEAPVEVTLYQGIPKASKMDVIIQKTTEMGIYSIVPVLTERTVVQLEGDRDKPKKADRWNKIAMEAAKQSKRGRIPKVHVPISYQEALSYISQQQVNMMAYEKESERGLKTLLSSLKEKSVQKVGIWIGPEGGFTEEEVDLAVRHHIYTVTLGPRILRTETAGFALLGMIMYELGDLGGL